MPRRPLRGGADRNFFALALRALTAVAPCAGARIETRIYRRDCRCRTCRPLRGGADRNITSTASYTETTGRPLRGGADRNSGSLMQTSPRWRRPLRGGADRNHCDAGNSADGINGRPLRGGRGSKQRRGLRHRVGDWSPPAQARIETAAVCGTVVLAPSPRGRFGRGSIIFSGDGGTKCATARGWNGSLMSNTRTPGVLAGRKHRVS